MEQTKILRRHQQNERRHINNIKLVAIDRFRTSTALTPSRLEQRPNSDK